MAIMIPWGFAHWEEYHDGTMLYGNGVWGITEANYALVILHYITCVVWAPVGSAAGARAVMLLIP